MKFLINDIFIVSAGAVIITTFSFLYYKDITARVQAGNNEMVGSLTYKRKTAERKYAGQVIWEGVENNVPVYNNDAIRTSDESEAMIRLKDGSEIKLNENSMILLAMNKNQIDIEFDRGSIQATRGDIGGKIGNLNIKSGNTRVSIEKSDVKLSQNKAGDLNLSVAKGNANIETGKGTAELGVDQTVVVAKDSGDVMKFELGIRLVNPSPDSYFLTASGKKRLDFSWLAIKGQYRVFFELSKEDLFDNIILTKEIKGNRFSAETEKGIYYWRIRAVHRITKKQESSDSRRFTVLWDEPVFLLSPEDKENITYKGNLPIINFKWTKSEIASAYRLILAGDASMQNIIKTFDTPQNNLLLDTIGRGIYYWKIEKISGLKNIPDPAESRVLKFSIAEKEIAGPPELIYPENEKQFSRFLLEKQKITFTWKNNPEIQNYNIKLAKDDKFKNIITTGESKVNFFQLGKSLPKGKYYWRVSGNLAGSEMTPPSLGRSFNIIDSEAIQLNLPEKNAILSPQAGEMYASIRFSWMASEIKGKYKLQISQTEDFSSVFKESIVKSPATGLSMQIEPGRYYWKVILVDEDGSILANCISQSFTVKSYLENPVVISPKDGYVVNMSDKNILALNWNRVAGANLYRVELYQVRKGKDHKIAETEENGTSFRFTDLGKLDESYFYWTLQAFEIAGGRKDVLRKSSIIKCNFKITLGKPVEKVNVDSLKIENL